MASVSLRQNRPEAEERNSHTYPHPENPGLIEQLDGYYDWAARRLFLIDGSPDPGTPGAYRYQTRPDLCDLEAPDSDPASPRYEPPHLRHQPGDTWEIGGKPHDPDDPDDPGPYGTPGWYQDRRTGRHRRNELPDPIPPWEQEPQAAEQEPNPQRHRDRASAGRPRPRPGHPERRGEDTEYRFGRLHEDAWDRFMTDSAPLAAAHLRPRTRTAAEREAGPVWGLWIHLLRWLITLITGAVTRPEETDAPVPRSAVPVDQHARMAHALAGAQRARTETRAPAADYVLEWERHFDTTHRIVGGASWA